MQQVFYDAKLDIYTLGSEQGLIIDGPDFRADYFLIESLSGRRPILMVDGMDVGEQVVAAFGRGTLEEHAQAYHRVGEPDLFMVLDAEDDAVPLGAFVYFYVLSPSLRREMQGDDKSMLEQMTG